MGPVLGAALLAGGFRVACLAGAAVFVVILAAHHRLMPDRREGAGSFAAVGVLLPVSGVAPALAFVVLLTLGQMLVVPAARAWLPDLVEDRRLGFFTGALSSVSGAVVLAGGAPVGALLERGGTVPWLVLAAVPALGLLGVRRAPGPRESRPSKA